MQQSRSARGNRGQRRTWPAAIGALLALAILAAPASGRARTASSNPFATRGMWIWEMGSSNGGSISSIIAQARRFGIATLYIKSSDGTGMWSQFSSATVRALRAAGLRVCAWQYVYGTYPRYEAQAGANAVRDGANCLVIDAEGQYEGKYCAGADIHRAPAAADRERASRSRSPGSHTSTTTPRSPTRCSSGPAVPSTTCRRCTGATSARASTTSTPTPTCYNRVYLRPIYPLGQVYNSPPPAQISRFRQFLQVYGPSA